MIADYYRYISYLDAQIGRVLDALAAKSAEADAAAEASVREKVKRLVSRFPIYQG